MAVPSNSTGLDSSLSRWESFYVGINLHDVLYGIQLCLYFETMRIILARRRTRQKSDVFYALFSTVMLLLITIWVAVNGASGQVLWVTDQNHPSRPIAFGYTDLSEVVALILQLMTDGFMMYRCQIMWDGLHAIILPSILWLATLVLGILSIWVSSVATTNVFWGDAPVSLAYFSMSVSLTAILTCMICCRLMYNARTKKKIGDDQPAPQISVITLLVDSVLPLTLTGIAFLIAFGLKSDSEVALALAYIVMTCVSPQMLIFRVVKGHTWQKDRTKQMQSQMLFRSGSEEISGSGNLGVTGTIIRLEPLRGVTPPAEESGKDVKLGLETLGSKQRRE